MRENYFWWQKDFDQVGLYLRPFLSVYVCKSRLVKPLLVKTVNRVTNTPPRVTVFKYSASARCIVSFSISVFLRSSPLSSRFSKIAHCLLCWTIGCSIIVLAYIHWCVWLIHAVVSFFATSSDFLCKSLMSNHYWRTIGVRTIHPVK